MRPRGVQDGRCKTLDAAADGYMRGEGCIVHLLQAFQPDQLEAAHLTDQAAVLHGTAVNQDGRSSSLTVRSPLLSSALGVESHTLMVPAVRLKRLP